MPDLRITVSVVGLDSGPVARTATVDVGSDPAEAATLAIRAVAEMAIGEVGRLCAGDRQPRHADAGPEWDPGATAVIPRITDGFPPVPPRGASF